MFAGKDAGGRAESWTPESVLHPSDGVIPKG